MTPSDYSNGNSLEHDRMQADVLDYIREHGMKETMFQRRGNEIPMIRVGVWPEVAIKVNGTLRGFIDILERWEPADKSAPHAVSGYLAYEIKPRLTTIGGLIRQMRAEELLIEQWRSGTSGLEVRTMPIVMHDDPEIPLLRRLWHGAVATWNAEEKTLS